MARLIGKRLSACEGESFGQEVTGSALTLAAARCAAYVRVITSPLRSPFASSCAAEKRSQSSTRSGSTAEDQMVAEESGKCDVRYHIL
eukprot:4995689-Pleurochrysis_carterae.AAC.2